MTAGELVALFRAYSGDTAPPYVWSDVELLLFANDAYFMFVRLTGGVPDLLSDDACLVQAQAGNPYSDLSSSVLVVRQATLEPSGEAVRVINAQDVEHLNDEDYGVLRRINTSSMQGKVRYMVVGMQPGVVRWVNVPDVQYDVRLLVDRLPLKSITSLSQSFTDVAEHHHLHLAKWIEHLAFSKPAEGADDPKRSEAAKMAFEQYCYQAKLEKERYKHKVRVVRYGGI
jgi:hypothetical protein